MNEAYIIVVGPGTYYVAEGHYTRDRSRAATFTSVANAKLLAANGWRVVVK